VPSDLYTSRVAITPQPFFPDPPVANFPSLCPTRFGNFPTLPFPHLFLLQVTRLQRNDQLTSSFLRFDPFPVTGCMWPLLPPPTRSPLLHLVAAKRIYIGPLVPLPRFRNGVFPPRTFEPESPPRAININPVTGALCSSLCPVSGPFTPCPFVLQTLSLPRLRLNANNRLPFLPLLPPSLFSPSSHLLDAALPFCHSRPPPHPLFD